MKILMEHNATAQATPLSVSRNPRPLNGTIRVPGDKSISHRALMLASLAEGRTVVTGLLEGEDVLRTADAMRALGATITQEEARWVIEGKGVGALEEPGDVLDMGNSGTAARLLSGILASHPITSFMTGDASLRGRPMRRVTQPLSGTGACFAARLGEKLPMAIVGTGDAVSLSYRLPVASAQVKSAILLAGLNARGKTRVEEPVATRDHTENMLRHFGVEVNVGMIPDGGRVITLEGPVRLKARDVSVPADPSSAAFPIVAACLIADSEVHLPGVGLNSLRTGLLTTLREMGAAIDIHNERVEGGEPVGDLTVRGGVLNAVDVPADRAPSMIDEYPILAVACAFARGISRLRGLEELRVKESDRFSATVAMLSGNGAVVKVEGNDMIIEGRGGAVGLGGGVVKTSMDHRLAMSGIVLGLAAEKPVLVDDTGFINTSFPGFVSLMTALGAQL